MKQTRVVIDRWDDLDLADGREVPADETLTLGLDGTTVELDLTTRRAKALREHLAPFMAAGQRPASEVGVDLGHKKMSRAYTTAMRAWADAQSPPVSYVTKQSGSYYYSVDLKRRFAAHLAATGEVVE